jgi:hypothetical protein
VTMSGRDQRLATMPPSPGSGGTTSHQDTAVVSSQDASLSPFENPAPAGASSRDVVSVRVAKLVQQFDDNRLQKTRWLSPEQPAKLLEDIFIILAKPVGTPPSLICDDIPSHKFCLGSGFRMPMDRLEVRRGNWRGHASCFMGLSGFANFPRIVSCGPILVG